MIDLWTIIQKTVLKCGGCFAVIVVNTGFVTFSLYIRTLRLTAIASETGMFHPLLLSESDSDPR